MTGGGEGGLNLTLSLRDFLSLECFFLFSMLFLSALSEDLLGIEYLSNWWEGPSIFFDTGCSKKTATLYTVKLVDKISRH